MASPQREPIRRRTPGSPASYPDGFRIREMLRMSGRLLTTAEATAWGLLGAVTGYVIAAWLSHNHTQMAILGKGEFAALGFVAFSAVYTLCRGKKHLTRCLATAHTLYVDDLITKEEYSKLRKKCLGVEAG